MSGHRFAVCRLLLGWQGAPLACSLSCWSAAVSSGGVILIAAPPAPATCKCLGLLSSSQLIWRAVALQWLRTSVSPPFWRSRGGFVLNWSFTWCDTLHTCLDHLRHHWQSPTKGHAHLARADERRAAAGAAAKPRLGQAAAPWVSGATGTGRTAAWRQQPAPCKPAASSAAAAQSQAPSLPPPVLACRVSLHMPPVTSARQAVGGELPAAPWAAPSALNSLLAWNSQDSPLSAAVSGRRQPWNLRDQCLHSAKVGTCSSGPAQRYALSKDNIHKAPVTQLVNTDGACKRLWAR